MISFETISNFLSDTSSFTDDIFSRERHNALQDELERAKARVKARKSDDVGRA